MNGITIALAPQIQMGSARTELPMLGGFSFSGSGAFTSGQTPAQSVCLANAWLIPAKKNMSFVRNDESYLPDQFYIWLVSQLLGIRIGQYRPQIDYLIPTMLASNRICVNSFKRARGKRKGDFKESLGLITVNSKNLSLHKRIGAEASSTHALKEFACGSIGFFKEGGSDIGPDPNAFVQ